MHGIQPTGIEYVGGDSPLQGHPFIWGFITLCDTYDVSNVGDGDLVGNGVGPSHFDLKV